MPSLPPVFSHRSSALSANLVDRSSRPSKDLNQGARVLGLKLAIANARSDADFEPAIAGFARQGAGGLLVASDAFFSGRVEPLAALATRYALPSIYADVRDFAAA